MAKLGVLRLWFAVYVLASVSLVPAKEPANQLEADVRFLASDDLEGRGVGTEGIRRAADHIRAAFAAAGLDVTRHGGDPFQEFEVAAGQKLGVPNTLEFVSPDGKTTQLEIGADFQVGAFGGSGPFAGEVVFCGYGIDAADKEYQDFHGIDLKGKVALVIRRTPFQHDHHGRFAELHGISRHAELRTKVSECQQRGAVACLIVNDPFTVNEAREKREASLAETNAEILKAAEELVAALDVAHVDQEQKVKLLVQRRQLLLDATGDDELMKFGYAAATDHNLPAYHISQAAANRMLVAAGQPTLDQLEKAINETGQPASRVLTGFRSAGQTTVERIREPASNVIGVLEGHGPHRDLTLIIGAHYDHLGRGGPGSMTPNSTEIHNGADDNASGAAVLLELARRLGAKKNELPLRVVLIAFSGEELGLLGSARYVKEPLFALKDTIAMLNLDMVGRLQENKLIVYGVKTSNAWRPWLDRHAGELKLMVTEQDDGADRSDHFTFYKEKIPVLHFFTGAHPDYHRPSDDVERLNLEGMQRVAELTERITWELLRAPQRPDFLEVELSSAKGRGGSRPYVGTIPDYSAEGPGYTISGTSPGSPADKGGLKAGDCIVGLGGAEIGGVNDFDLVLRKHKTGAIVQFRVRRAAEELVLEVVLGMPR